MLAAARSETLFLLLLLACAYSITHQVRIGPDLVLGLPEELKGSDVSIWVTVLLIQAIPYAASLIDFARQRDSAVGTMARCAGTRARRICTAGQLAALVDSTSAFHLRQFHILRSLFSLRSFHSFHSLHCGDTHRSRSVAFSHDPASVFAAIVAANMRAENAAPWQMQTSSLSQNPLRIRDELSHHLPAFTIGLASWLAFLPACTFSTKRIAWREPYLFWLKIFAVSFALGVVSGIVAELSVRHELGWSLRTRRQHLGPAALVRGAHRFLPRSNLSSA